MPGCFTVGERLAEIALRRDSGQALASIVTDMGGDLSDAGDLLPGVPPPKRCFQVKRNFLILHLLTASPHFRSPPSSSVVWRLIFSVCY